MPAVPKKPIRLLPLLLLVVLMLPSCSFHIHRVGTGPIGRGEVSERQYFILFGWLRLNEVSSDRMAGELTSYEIVTERSLVDILLSPLLMPLTVTSRTVTVKR